MINYIVMGIKINNLMALERLLLEIDARFKFDLEFGEAYKLHEFLKSVGKITSYAFLIQDEYHQKYKDVEKLKEYHKLVMDSFVEFNYKEVIDFIIDVNGKVKNEEFENIISEIKFWN